MSSSATAPLAAAIKRQLRQRAHHLHPVVMLGDQGLTEGVVAETDRALRDHELIKVKLPAGDREQRTTLGDALAAASGAAIVQRIGRNLVLFRENPEADPRLSNRQRAR